VLAAGDPLPDGRLQSANGDVLTVSYATRTTDTATPAGAPRRRGPTAAARDLGPGRRQPDERAATVRFATTSGRHGRPVGHDPGAGPRRELAGPRDLPQPRRSTSSTAASRSTCASRAPTPPGSGGRRRGGRTARVPHLDDPGLYWRETFEARHPAGRCRASGRSARALGKGGATFGFPTPSRPTTTPRSSATTSAAGAPRPATTKRVRTKRPPRRRSTRRPGAGPS